MAETNQANPELAENHSSNNDEKAQRSKRNRLMKLCVGICATFLLLLVIVIVILIFTVFKIKNPKITINGTEFKRFDVSIKSIIPPQVKVRMLMLVDMSVKNSNAVSMKLGNSTTTIYYHDMAIAEAQIPAGLMAKAQRTLRMNVTVDMMVDRLISSPDLMMDLTKGKMKINSYSVISGRVKVLFVKKFVKVGMNCTMTVQISSRNVEDYVCQPKIL